MGRIFKKTVPGAEEQIYRCLQCSSSVASTEEIVSKSFHGRGGRAYLISGVLNVYKGPAEVRVLMTGLHTVADIFCNQCHALLGWTYIEAVQESEKYKIGKFVLERTKITGTRE